MPTTGITRNDAYIRKGASGLCWIKEVEATGADLGTPDTIKSLGRVQKSSYERTASVTYEADQGGVKINAGSTIDAKMTIDCMQRDKIHINLPNAIKGEYMQIIQELTHEALNGKYQALVLPVCLIEDTLKVDGTNMYPQFIFGVQPAGAAVTVDFSDLTDTWDTLGGTLNIAIGDYEGIHEETPP